jgi:hypothetical protein
MEGNALPFCVGSQSLDAIGIVDGVDLAGSHELRFLEKRRVVERELASDRFEVVDRIAAGTAGDIHEMHQHLRALDVSEELMAQSQAPVSALDQAWNVGRGGATAS